MIKCDDCGRPKGKLHACGCDIERCPRCGMQLITCDCKWKSISKKLKFLVDIDGKRWKRLVVRTICDILT